jgi:hypothetical protein
MKSLAPQVVEKMSRASRLTHVFFRADQWMKDGGQSIDDATMALAYWLADPYSGRLSINMQSRCGEDGNPMAIGIHRITYQPAAANGMYTEHWTIRGSQDIKRDWEVHDAAAKQGFDVSSNIPLDVKNLNGVLKDWGQPKADLRFAKKLAQDFYQPEEPKFTASPEALNAKWAGVDLDLEPFQSWKYVDFLICRDCSPELRVGLLTMPSLTLFLNRAMVFVNVVWVRDLTLGVYDLNAPV